MVLPVRHRLFYTLLLILLVSGCAQKNISLPIEPGSNILLDDTPFFAQEEYQCGPAALAMILGASGIQVDPEALVPLTYIPERRGSLQLELIAATRNFQRIPFVIEPKAAVLVDELRRGHPVLVLQNYGLDILPAYHYAVVIGAGQDEVILRSGTTKELHMGLSQFLMSWKRPGSWGLIALKPGKLPAHSSPERYLKAVNGFEQNGHAEQVEQAYLAALKRWPENNDILFALGNNAMLQGKLNEAESHFRNVLAAQPNNIAAANNLADALLKRGCLPQASAIINQAVEDAGRKESPLLPFVLQSKKEIDSSLTNTHHSKENKINYGSAQLDKTICNNDDN